MRSSLRGEVGLAQARIRQVLIIGSALLIAVLLEVVVLTRLGIPGATPDLLCVTVVAFALVYGPEVGAYTGFAGGLLLGFAPPSDGSPGVQALIYLALGIIAGAIVDPRDRTVPLILGMVGLSAGSIALLNALFTAVLNSDRVNWSQVPLVVLAAALWALILSPVVMPLVGKVAKGLTPELIIT